MYLGMVAMMLGMGLATGVPFMAIAALNFVVIVATVHIPHEEAQMRRAFGGWYSDYAARRAPLAVATADAATAADRRRRTTGSAAGRVLRRFQFDLQHATRPSEGLKRLRQGGFDVAILDVMLPEMDGFELCRTIRKDSQIPIVMLTARGDVMDRVVGLELGADDYLPKPFEPRELLARIQTILRRSAPASGHGARQLRLRRRLGDRPRSPHGAARAARRSSSPAPSSICW